MALSYMATCGSHTPKSEVILSGDRLSKVLEDFENQHDLTTFDYRHTTRKAIALVDMENSIQAADAATSPGPLLLNKEQNDDGEIIITFAGREYYWNNQLRREALTQGLDKYVPQVLYLVRPETAYISCLHFLARELGGIDEFKSQREFIFRNSGLQTLMGPFWIRVQETCWSGGFSPGIGEEDRLLLLLALIECQTLTHADGPTRPHLPLPILRAAGIFLPSVEYPEWVPTPTAMDTLKESQKRTNHPGVPNPLGSYVECYACMHPLPLGEEHQCISVPIVCTPCGMKFPSHDVYQVHVLTFCKQGPLTQSRCACCNTPGPQCLCTVHWKRTHDLALNILGGKVEHAAELARHGLKVPAILMEAKTFLPTTTLLPDP